MRMFKASFAVCIKQLQLGELNEDQRATLLRTALNYATELYRRKHSSAAEVLLQLWQVTSNRKAAWMYMCAKVGIPYHHLQRINAYRKRARRLLVHPA